MKRTTTQLLNFKLSSILDFTKAINENQPVDALLSKYAGWLRNDLSIGKVVFYQKEGDNWLCLLKDGISRELSIDVETDLKQYDDITFIAEIDGKFSGFDIIMPVYNNNAIIAYVLIGDIEEEGEGVSPVIRHSRFIQTLANIIAVAIENRRLIKQQLEQEALKKEIELAAQMQQMLVPDIHTLPHTNQFAMTAYYKPFYGVGGDYFDCIKLNDHCMGICVADVSGKGLAAALLMSNFQATFRALFTDDVDLEALTHKLNKNIIDRVQGDRFITMFLARYNYQTNELEYVNAGHTTAVCFDTVTKQTTMLETTCMAVGMIDEIPNVNAQKLQLQNHSLLLSYSDGLVELISSTDENDVDIVFDKLVECTQQSTTADELRDRIVEMHNLNGINKAIFDDVTMVCAEFKK